MFNEVIELQVEHTSICNAACPMCIREIKEDKSWFTESYLPDNFYIDNIPKDVMKQLKKVTFNGVIGDPCCAPNLLNAVKQFVIFSEADITISTNGGMRNIDFWKELADVLKDRGRVIFAIDGLKDTNHIYRVNVNYNSVMRNSQAFIDAGGKATWQFISFRHNEHQIRAAKSLAHDMGFNDFFVKPSYRFVVDDMIGVERYGANRIKIEPPTENVHPLVQQKKFDMDMWHESTKNSKINCFAKHNGSLYMDYKGNLFPCCPISAGQMARQVIQFKDGWDELWEQHGHTLALHNNKWEDIVSGPFFNEVVRRWDVDFTNGRLAACAGTCSDSEYKFNNRGINGSNQST